MTIFVVFSINQVENFYSVTDNSESFFCSADCPNFVFFLWHVMRKWAVCTVIDCESPTLEINFNFPNVLNFQVDIINFAGLSVRNYLEWSRC